jgi:hypothetical protein
MLEPLVLILYTSNTTLELIHPCTFLSLTLKHAVWVRCPEPLMDPVKSFLRDIAALQALVQSGWKKKLGKPHKLYKVRNDAEHDCSYSHLREQKLATQ